MLPFCITLPSDRTDGGLGLGATESFLQCRRASRSSGVTLFMPIKVGSIELGNCCAIRRGAAAAPAKVQFVFVSRASRVVNAAKRLVDTACQNVPKAPLASTVSTQHPQKLGPLRGFNSGVSGHFKPTSPPSAPSAPLSSLGVMSIGPSSILLLGCSCESKGIRAPHLGYGIRPCVGSGFRVLGFRV